MATKNNPGLYDCYANAEPDEPMFHLLGRDPMAPLLVRIWAELRDFRGENPAKVEEARACADNMEAWHQALGKKDILPEDGLVAIGMLISRERTLLQWRIKEFTK